MQVGGNDGSSGKDRFRIKGYAAGIQDLIAPELRELKVEVRAINERLTLMDERFDRLDHRFDRMDQRFERMEQSITNGFEGIRRQLDTYNDVQQLK